MEKETKEEKKSEIKKKEVPTAHGLKKQKEEKQENKTREVRIPRETLMRLDIGRPMFSVVISAYERGILDILDASKILNLRVNKIDKLVAGSI